MSQTNGRLQVLAALALTFAFVPTPARAQDAQNTPPSTTAAPTPSTAPAAGDQQPAYQNGVPSGPSTALETTPPPPPHRRPRVQLGIDAGVFLPSSAKTRNRFGDAWWSTGIGIGAIHQASGHGSWGVDIRTRYESGSNDNHVFVGALGAEYRRRFNPAETSTQFTPYYGGAVDLMFVDISAPQDNVGSSLRTTGGASVFVGTTIGNQEFVDLRYEAMPDVEGFNLSGFSVSAGVRFF